MSDRLKSDFWVGALIRRCQIEGVPVSVVRHGDDQAGSVLVKINLLNGSARVYAPARSGQGEFIWVQAVGQGSASEAEVDAYITRTLKHDPDLWVIEIEDKAGRHFLTEPVQEKA